MVLTTDYPFPDVEEGKSHITHGVKLAPGETPGIRYELRELHKDTDVWNLYMLGLFQWHNVPQDRHFSWLRIAGIHGYPFKPWPPNDPLVAKMDRRSKEQVGFCTHSSVLFLSWHRPYLALYEEVLQKIISIVADKFTEAEGRTKWKKAAKSFRVPFWDWARTDLPTFPDECIAYDKIKVVMPKAMRDEHGLGAGPEVEIHNPLFSYRFQDATPDGFKMNNKQTTVRYDSPGEIDPEGDGADPEVVKKRLEAKLKPYDNGVLDGGVKMEGNLTERVVYLLSAYDKFFMFTANSYTADPNVTKDADPAKQDSASVKTKGGGFGSLEDIHNTMHELAGGSGGDYKGHMAEVAWSAFDPIFWLHHANVDRLFAIWQALHDQPDNKYAYVTPQKAVDTWGGTWVTKPGETEDINTPLVPFYKSDGKFYDSTGVRYTRDLGYAYPETQEWKFRGNKTAFRKSVVSDINRLYSAGSLANMITKKRTTGSHEDEDKIYARAKLWKSVQKSSEKKGALSLLSLAKGLSATAASTGSAVTGAVSSATPSWSLTSQATGSASQSLASLARGLRPAQAAEDLDMHDHPELDALAVNGIYDEWMFNVVAEKHSLGGRYTVHVFLGPVDPDEKPHLFSISPNHVGTFSPLGQDEDTGCGKCLRDQASGERVTGQVPLTIALVERYFAGEIPNIGHDAVIPYLQKNLHWEVVDHNGNRLPGGRNAIRSLQVAISSNEVKVPPSLEELPVYSADLEFWPDATTKPDGSGRAEGTGVTRSTLSTFLL